MKNTNQNNNSGLGSVVGWIVGVGLILLALIMIFSSLVTGIVLLAAAAIILPPSANFLKQRFNISLSGKMKTLAVIVLTIIGIIFVPTDTPTNKINEQVTQNEIIETEQSNVTQPVAIVTPPPVQPISQPKPQPTPTPQPKPAPVVSQEIYYSVTGVVDGDTIKISMNGVEETLRLIGMDTPETVDPRKPVQCFGKEASNKGKELLSYRKVRIEKDPSQGDRDKYGRLLAYVYRDDGLFYNKYMIAEGYAHEYMYDMPYKYQADFKAAQLAAQQNQRGLWSPNTCNGDTTQPASGGDTTTQPQPATTSSGTNFYTSSHYSAKYWYPAACDGWKDLSKSYLKSYNTIEELLAQYPSKTKSPQCN